MFNGLSLNGELLFVLFFFCCLMQFLPLNLKIKIKIKNSPFVVNDLPFLSQSHESVLVFFPFKIIFHVKEL
jgi:hypothetical protein